jgi:hypothetical protein
MAELSKLPLVKLVVSFLSRNRKFDELALTLSALRRLRILSLKVNTTSKLEESSKLWIFLPFLLNRSDE